MIGIQNLTKQFVGLGVLAVTSGLIVGNLILFLLGIKSFQRESVLFKWK